MSGSLNKVQLIGNLGRDPEVRTMQSGGQCASFSVATSESWKDKQSGDRRQRTEWHRVVVFDEKLVELAEQYLKKGSKVYLEGQLQTRKWTDSKGAERYTTEMVLQRFRSTLTMLDNKGNGDYPPTVESAAEYGTVTTQDTPPPDNSPQADLDDDIPF